MELRGALSNYDTGYKQNLEFEKAGWVAPVEIFLEDENSYMYVPILKQLKELLKHDDVLSHIITRPLTDVSIIDSYSKGSSHKTNSLFSTKPSIQIQLYCDDFQIVNVVGN